MIKDIVLHLSADAKHDVAAKYAVSVAEAFGANLAAVTFAYETVLPATLMGGGLPVDFINEQRALDEVAPQAAMTRLKEMARRSGVAVEVRLETTSLAGAADIFGHLARQFDLSIVGQANPDVVGPQELIIEAALFQSGRPVVVVPYRLGSRSIAFWCGGTEGAKRRAPSRMHCRFSTAPKPVVVVATKPLKSDDSPGADIARHLDLNVCLKRVVTGGTDVANTILSYAADVFVMGGYGHSRLREFILGGATRGVLSSMTIPAFMSH
jgi:hypothetical protein